MEEFLLRRDPQFFQHNPPGQIGYICFSSHIPQESEDLGHLCMSILRQSGKNLGSYQIRGHFLVDLLPLGVGRAELSNGLDLLGFDLVLGTQTFLQTFTFLEKR